MPYCSFRNARLIWLCAFVSAAPLIPLVVSCSSPSSAPLPSSSNSSTLAPVQVPPSASLSASASASGSSAAPSGSSSAASPFSDKLLYSTGIETIVRALAERSGRPIGYLRAGNSVHRSAQPVSTEGCKDGWYAVEPKGFVCASEGATLDENNGVVSVAQPLPGRGKPLPYVYGAVKGAAPHYYFKLPTREDIRKAEGSEALGKMVAAAPDPYLSLIGEESSPPQYLLDGGRIPRPAGGAARLRFWIHTGRAEPNTRMGFLQYFKHEGRRWGISSQLDIIAMDRIRLIKPSDYHGIELSADDDLPVAFVRSRGAIGFKADENGKLTERVPLGHRQAIKLTGKEREEKSAHLLETKDGLWVADSALQVVAKRQIPTFVKNDEMRWIDVGIDSQVLVAYEGKRAVYVTLVSTGTGRMGDPETTHATPRGVFQIFSKHVSTKMSGDELGGEYLIDDVPYVQYFQRSYAIHGAFWHDDFGHVHSHGCVNLAPADAAWVFEFTRPEVPQGWHGAFVASGGTTLFIHK